MKQRVCSLLMALGLMLTMAPAALATGDEAENGGNTQTEVTTVDELKTALSAAAATKGTVTLDADITVSQGSEGKNAAIINVPVGVTLDGGGHTITAGTWSTANNNHILAVVGNSASTQDGETSDGTTPTTTIKNVTIVGNANTKSGIHVYNCAETVKLENVTIQNCGNAAVQVNNSTVVASNLTTSGNVWGAVNVDKGNPSFELKSGTLNEPVKIWTEIDTTGEDGKTGVITVPENWPAMPSYDEKTYYVDPDSVPVKIGDNPYATLRDAALAAINDTTSTSKTITLCTDVTVADVDAEGLAVNNAVVTLPDGWTLDGGNHTITAAQNWGNTSHHILGINGAATVVTIQDVTIVGNNNTKHGINAYTSGDTVGKLTVNNVTIKDCGTAGMVIKNTEVTATNLTTSGNAWGAVNVDDATGSKLTLDKANLAENVQVWTEQTSVSGDTITINGTDFAQVTGTGGTLKGFTYYTTDMAKLGEAKIVKEGKTTVYATLADAITAAASGGTIDLLKDVNSEAVITLPGSVTLNGNGKTIKYTGNTGANEEPVNGAFITVSASSDNTTIQNVTIDTNGKVKHGVQFYSNKNGKLENVTVNGGAWTSVLVNGAEVTVKDADLKPDANAYATIEYAMGEAATSIPQLTLNNVTCGKNDPTVWADNDTVTKVKTTLGEEATADTALDTILSKITTQNNQSIQVSVQTEKGAEGSDGTVESITKPSTKPSTGGSGGGVTTYTLTFDANGGSAVEKVKGERNDVIDLGKYVTAREGYTFAGWYADEALTDKVTSVKLTKNLTVYAKWEKVEQPVTLPFTDVAEGAWYYDSVAYVYEKGMMNGVTATTFGPELTTTRAMIVTMLYRLEGSPAVSGDGVFTDVEAGAWYAAGVNWAAANGVVNGVSPTEFAPNAPITREQMAAILYRYANHKGYDVSQKADLGKYADAEKVSAYAADAMAWANGAGIVGGVTADTLDPQGSATRAQVAAMMQRFCAAQ